MIEVKQQPIPILDTKYKPTYLGVACGTGRTGHILSGVWVSMIDRCYNKKHKAYKFYGAKGVCVCNDWLSFDGFLKDAICLDGYSNKILYPSEYEIDKDKSGGMIYGKDTCRWVTRNENESFKKNTTTYKFRFEYVVKKGDELFKFFNILGFCKTNNMSYGNFHGLLSGKRDISYGYTLISKTNITKDPSTTLGSLHQTNI